MRDSSTNKHASFTPKLIDSIEFNKKKAVNNMSQLITSISNRSCKNFVITIL